jgi:ferritin-like metal-binding protein YciE
MAESGSLHDAFIDELRDAYDAEKQLLKALAKLSKAATAPDLKAAFDSHREETQGHVERLEQVFASIDEKVRGKHCDGIAGIIEEGKSVMEEDFDDATMDACLIASGQRAEHYEMAAYGTLVAWARTMGHDEAADLLQQTLDEEKAADEKLNQLAEGGINENASPHQDGGEMAQEDEDDASSSRGAGRGAGRGTAASGRAASPRAGAGSKTGGRGSSQGAAKKTTRAAAAGAGARSGRRM